MKKDAYYFSHDSNAREDEKILELRLEHDWYGYGLYWAIIEMLRDASKNVMQKNYKRIAFALQTDSKRIESIINDFDLFTVTEDEFWSESLKNRMEIKEAKSEKARKAALKRWGKVEEIKVVDNEEVNANALQPHCNGNAIKGKERKGKEIKINKIYSDFVDEVKNGFHNQWAEETYMRLKLKKGTLTNLLDLFRSHLITSETLHETIPKLKTHLNNWLNKQEEIGKLKEYKRKSIGAI